jgi:hypothetical protein
MIHWSYAVLAQDINGLLHHDGDTLMLVFGDQPVTGHHSTWSTLSYTAAECNSCGVFAGYLLCRTTPKKRGAIAA